MSAAKSNPWPQSLATLDKLWVAKHPDVPPGTTDEYNKMKTWAMMTAAGSKTVVKHEDIITMYPEFKPVAEPPVQNQEPVAEPTVKNQEPVAQATLSQVC